MSKITLFQDTSNQNILLNVDMSLSATELHDSLWKWLEFQHVNIYYHIELYEGGSISIENDTIVFMGDNGMFELNAISVETL